MPFFLVQYVALRPSQCEDFHTEHCLVWGFNVVYLMHMCFFKIILGVCDSVHEISFVCHWFQLCAVQDHHQFNSLLCFKVFYKFICAFISFFSYLEFDCYCCTLFGRQCNRPGVTHTVFFMPACLILGLLLKDIRCILTIGMLVLKANFIHIKVLKCLIQNVLQKCLSLNKPCNIQCSDNW